MSFIFLIFTIWLFITDHAAIHYTRRPHKCQCLHRRWLPRLKSTRSLCTLSATKTCPTDPSCQASIRRCVCSKTICRKRGISGWKWMGNMNRTVTIIEACSQIFLQDCLRWPRQPRHPGGDCQRRWRASAFRGQSNGTCQAAGVMDCCSTNRPPSTAKYM